MLVVSRKAGERVLVGDQIIVTVVQIGPSAIRIGIDAPKCLNIVREELAAVEPIAGVAVPATFHIPRLDERNWSDRLDGEDS